MESVMAFRKVHSYFSCLVCLLLPFLCRCRRLWFHLITGSDTHPHTHTTLGRILLDRWSENFTRQHTTMVRDRLSYPGGFGTSSPKMCAAADPRLGPHDHLNRRRSVLLLQNCVRELWTAKKPCQVCRVRSENKKQAPPRMRAGFLINESLRFVFVFMDCYFNDSIRLCNFKW